MADKHLRKPSLRTLFQGKEALFRTRSPSGPAEAMLREIFQRQRRKFLRFLAQVIANEIQRSP